MTSASRRALNELLVVPSHTLSCTVEVIMIDQGLCYHWRPHPQAFEDEELKKILSCANHYVDLYGVISLTGYEWIHEARNYRKIYDTLHHLHRHKNRKFQNMCSNNIAPLISVTNKNSTNLALFANRFGLFDEMSFTLSTPNTSIDARNVVRFVIPNIETLNFGCRRTTTERASGSTLTTEELPLHSRREPIPRRPKITHTKSNIELPTHSKCSCCVAFFAQCPITMPHSYFICVNRTSIHTNSTVRACRLSVSFCGPLLLSHVVTRINLVLIDVIAVKVRDHQVCNLHIYTYCAEG